MGSNSDAAEKTKQTNTSPADVIMWSGCKDSQTSADATEAGKATGAMSYVSGLAICGMTELMSRRSSLL